MMKTLEKSLMADGSSSDMLLLKVLNAGNTSGIYCISSKFNNSPFWQKWLINRLPLYKLPTRDTRRKNLEGEAKVESDPAKLHD